MKWFNNLFKGKNMNIPSDRFQYIEPITKTLTNEDLFKTLVIEPTTKYLGLSSESANDLLLGTAILESNIEHTRQIPSGIARSLFQIEPNTLKDVYKNYLNFREPLKEKVDSLLYGRPTIDNRIRNLEVNPFYACAIARICYLRAPKKLPSKNRGLEDYIKGLAYYWKQYYNTPLGAGTTEKAEHIFAKVVKVRQEVDIIV
jgi:hypothetical protein